MERFSEECLEVFLREQSQLFDEPVAETPEEAEAFLEDCMAVVLDSLEEVRDYLDEYGADVDGMTLGEIEDASEVFALPGEDSIWSWKDRKSRGSISVCLGFFQCLLDCIQDEIGCIGVILAGFDLVCRLGLDNLSGDFFHGRLDKGIHRFHAFVQVGKPDRIDMVFVHGHLHFQRCIIECHAGSVDSGLIVFGCLLSFCMSGQEHKEQKQDEEDPKGGKNGGVDDLLHVKYDDFCFGTHKSKALLSVRCQIWQYSEMLPLYYI